MDKYNNVTSISYTMHDDTGWFSDENIEMEHIEEVTSMELPMDWKNILYEDKRVQGVHVNSIADALIMSLSNMACVDIEYISAITGQDYKSVICELKGSIYQNPDKWGECFFKGWEMAEEYLSGNLIKKWKVAKQANEDYNGYFSDNLVALEAVLPPSVATKDIYITLGSPWVPVHVIDDFITHILAHNGIHSGRYRSTKHDEITGSWELPHKSMYKHNIVCSTVYGTWRMDALTILEKTLNMKTVCIYDEVKNDTSTTSKKRVINKVETVLALDKQKKLIAEFQEWVWSDKTRAKELERIFEDNYSLVRRRIYDGSFLEFPNMSKSITLHSYQKNAVARILFSANTLLAHDVGSGKTYIMIAAGMELKRMGMTKKNLYVVPNNIVGQWKNIFLEMYENAKLLIVEPKNFKPNNRHKILTELKNDEYDAIIMAYSCFERIQLSREFYIEEIKAKLDKISETIKDRSKATSKLISREKKLKEELSELVIKPTGNEDNIFFDELGITRLFVDEAHNYKNVPIETKIDKVLGISVTGSKKCKDMMEKVRYIQRVNNGGGVVMATGTPITNSITDAFIMQKYLQSGELALLELQNFDSWVGMFAERSTEFEIDVDTSSYRLATRFARFHNLPELTSLLSSIADFHQVDKSDGLPEFEGYTDTLIEKTEEFSDYLKDISRRAEQVRGGYVERTEDNMLKITTDGRKAALDMRLVDATARFSYQSKVMRCVENVLDIYIKTEADKSTQLIFCDSSTPKRGFNIYDEIKNLLLHEGIEAEKIAFVHDATTEAKRENLFKKVRKGQVRILIGSTFKLGIGVNIQDKLIAIHHIDVPWRPADMTQREGRILRQGNENEKVCIYRYITQGSFDAYSWQLLETKQRFITRLLSGAMTQRSGDDIESTVLNYAEVKALAVGNPLVKERVETANELAKYLTLQRKLVDTRLRLQKELMELPAKLEHQRDMIEKSIVDMEYYHSIYRSYNESERKYIREKLHTAINEHILETKEKPLLLYQGFKVVLPANMSKEKPYVWLVNEGKYYVGLGDTKIGALIRIDNFLEGFEQHIKKLEEKLVGLEERRDAIIDELSRENSYIENIDECRKRIEQIDKELGVDKHE